MSDLRSAAQAVVDADRDPLSAKYPRSIAMGMLRAALDAAPPAGLREALEAAVSNALSAATEGSDYLEAPEPSDEPGSDYVRAIAASLAAAGVGFAAPPAGLREALTPEQLDAGFGHPCGHVCGIPKSRHKAEEHPWVSSLLAAPSCGHPIDAERLARAMLAVYDVAFGPVAAARSKAVAAAYAGEES